MLFILANVISFAFILVDGGKPEKNLLKASKLLYDDIKQELDHCYDQFTYIWSILTEDQREQFQAFQAWLDQQV